MGRGEEGRCTGTIKPSPAGQSLSCTGTPTSTGVVVQRHHEGKTTTKVQDVLPLISVLLHLFSSLQVAGDLAELLLEKTLFLLKRVEKNSSLCFVVICSDFVIDASVLVCLGFFGFYFHIIHPIPGNPTMC